MVRAACWRDWYLTSSSCVLRSTDSLTSRRSTESRCWSIFLKAAMSPSSNSSADCNLYT